MTATPLLALRLTATVVEPGGSPPPMSPWRIVGLPVSGVDDVLVFMRSAANDRYGHGAGDALIRATANLLDSCVRESNLVARTGGDESAVLLRCVDNSSGHRSSSTDPPCGSALASDRTRPQPTTLPGLGGGCRQRHRAARRVADRRMYANKRRGAASSTRSSARRTAERRRRQQRQG